MEKKPKKPGLFYRRPDGEKFRFSANCCVLEFKEDGTLGFFKTFLNHHLDSSYRPPRSPEELIAWIEAHQRSLPQPAPSPETE